MRLRARFSQLDRPDNEIDGIEAAPGSPTKSGLRQQEPRVDQQFHVSMLKCAVQA